MVSARSFALKVDFVAKVLILSLKSIFYPGRKKQKVKYLITKNMGNNKLPEVDEWYWIKNNSFRAPLLMRNPLILHLEALFQ